MGLKLYQQVVDSIPSIVLFWARKNGGTFLCVEGTLFPPRGKEHLPLLNKVLPLVRLAMVTSRFCMSKQFEPCASLKFGE
jgi:hypothetical protein